MNSRKSGRDLRLVQAVVVKPLGSWKLVSQRIKCDADNETEIDISIVIVNYRCALSTIQAVKSAQSEGMGLGLEIIIVDNNSNDGSIGTLQTALPRVRVLDAGYNGGYAWGNGVGMNRSRGRYILVLNPDSILHPGSLVAAVAIMDQHPDIGVLGPLVRAKNGSVDQTRFRLPRLSFLFFKSILPYTLTHRIKVFGDQRYASLPIDQPADVEAVVGCFLMVPRAVIDEVGPMDHRFFLYSEETEWCWRIRNAGYRVHYHPDVHITHIGGGSTGPISAFTAVETAKSMVLFFRITRGPAVALVATLILIFGDLLRSPWYLPQLFTKKGRKKAETWKARIQFLIRALAQQPRGQNPPNPRTHPVIEYGQCAEG